MRSLTVLGLLLSVAAAHAQVPAPKPSIATLADLPVVVSAPYDEKADADAVVAATFAKAKAKADHKRVLLDLGGNWCPDCIILANFLRLPEIKAFVVRHYVVAAVDVGRFNKNLQVPARFGYITRLKGVPTVLIAEPDGRLVNGSDVFAFTDARHMTPQALADYLAKWAAP